VRGVAAAFRVSNGTLSLYPTAHPELVEGASFPRFELQKKKKQPFDKLRASGVGGGIALILAPLLLGATPAKPVNWTSMVTQMPSGAFVLGNPRAKVRLVEYISYSCSHCAEFVGESKVPLKRDYVAKGLVAVELRNAVRDQFDLAAALLARCSGGARFFGHTEALLASQSVWLGKAPAFYEKNGARLAKLPPSEGLKLTARGVGLDTVMKARGLSQAQIDACLINKPAQMFVLGMTKEAFETRKITGTPAFLVNETQLQGAGHWAIVEPAIKAALGTS
jgi:protein-disulfide isomerase